MGLKSSDWSENDTVSFCIKIKVKGNEALIAEFKRMASESKLTQHIIQSTKKRKGVQQELPI